MSEKVAIIGAGWLGTPLALVLLEKGYDVLATKRDPEQCRKLMLQGIDAHRYELDDGKIPEELGEADYFIINIAPGRKVMVREEFVPKMIMLFEQCMHRNPNSKILFISTTSVYGEQDRVIEESTEPNPLTESAKAHCELEQYLQTHFPDRSSILRLAGLVGEDRNPVYHFAGKTEITAAAKVINFVHRYDIIVAIQKILERQVWSKVMHLCSTDHPKRIDYYKWAAEQLFISEPKFIDESEQEACGKRVNAEKTLVMLGLELKYPSPFDMVRKKAESDINQSE